jgi:hypothetical protein
MKRFFLLLCALTLGGAAQAQTVELSGTFGSQPFSVNLALQDFVLIQNPEISLEAGVSTQRAQLGARTALEFAAIGRATAFARFALSYTGGVRFEAGAKGAIGPVSLELASAAWSAPITNFDPNANFTWNPEPASGGGFYIGAQGAYRLSRTLVLNAGARYGTAQSRITLRLENRAGDFSYGGGVLLAWQSNGLTSGVTASARLSPQNQPYGLEGQVFAGINEIVGFGFGGAGLSVDYTLEELGTLNAFAIYEVWRLDVLPLRFGASANLNVGPGVLFAQGFGGADLDWAFGWGVRLGYRLDLGALLNP